MKKNVLVAGALAAALSLTVVGCGGNGGAPATTDNNGGTQAEQPEKGGDEGFDAVEAYYGQWRGSVKITGQTVYGTAGGSEQMLDVNLEKDGTCTVVPLEAHADLLSAEGTWEGTEDTITLHLGDGDITLKVVDPSKLEGTASDFDIADFETIDFDFYG